jgi:hypothetical protein
MTDVFRYIKDHLKCGGATRALAVYTFGRCVNSYGRHRSPLSRTASSKAIGLNRLHFDELYPDFSGTSSELQKDAST